MQLHLQLPDVKRVGPFDRFNTFLNDVEFVAPIPDELQQNVRLKTRIFCTRNSTLIHPEFKEGGRILQFTRRSSDRTPPTQSIFDKLLLELKIIDRETFNTRATSNLAT